MKRRRGRSAVTGRPKDTRGDRAPTGKPSENEVDLLAKQIRSLTRPQVARLCELLMEKEWLPTHTGGNVTLVWFKETGFLKPFPDCPEIEEEKIQEMIGLGGTCRYLAEENDFLRRCARMLKEQLREKVRQPNEGLGVIRTLVSALEVVGTKPSKILEKANAKKVELRLKIRVWKSVASMQASLRNWELAQKKKEAEKLAAAERWGLGDCDLDEVLKGRHIDAV